MNKFPNEIEKEFLIFLYEYHYLRFQDSKFLFKSMIYYKRQISSLIKNDYIKKHDSGCYILSEVGKIYLKSLGYDFKSKMAYSKKYIERQIQLSFIGAFYHYSKTVKFIPSFKTKDKEIFTIKSRRFIGTIKINQKEYLAYYINQNQDIKYINSVFFDIQKEQRYRNIIIFADDVKMLNINKFSFGLKEVLIIKTDNNSLEKLCYIDKINWPKIIKNKYGTKVFLSEYNFCDYTNKKDIFVSLFSYINTEKINLIVYFLKENPNVKVDIICCKDIVDFIKKELPNQNYVVVDLEKYVEGKFNIYE